MRNSSIICVDASLIVRLVAFPRDEQIRESWQHLKVAGQLLVAPMLLRYEVTNAMYRYAKTGTVSMGVVQDALRAAFALPLILYSDAELHERALMMATHFNLPAAYDAHYLALAEQVGAAFWTMDRRLVNTVGDALPWVHLVPQSSIQTEESHDQDADV
jgi:predicted nucleic acid-binding protein